jgi:predicted O-linked N-acetylglucosamine transferase (SPINDLY family)
MEPAQDPSVISHALNERGVAYARAGNAEAAQQAFEQAIRARPDMPSAYNNLGNILRRQNRLQDAEFAFLRSISLDPFDSSGMINLGRLYWNQGRYPEATAVLRNATRAKPDEPEAWRALGQLLVEISQPQESLAVFKRLIELVPRDAEAHMELAKVYHELRQWAEAETSYRRSLEIDPGLSAAHANFAFLLSDQGLTRDAQQHYGKAYDLQPSPRLRIVRDTMVPPIYQSVEQIREVREELRENHRRLIADGVTIDPTERVMPTLFYLTYHGFNDREFMVSHARLGDAPRSVKVDLRPPRSGKIRIGFISKCLRDHTIGRLNRDIIAGLSRDDFDVTFFSIGPSDDAIGQAIRQRADRYLVVPGSLNTAIQMIAAQQLDILYYPDIGMDPFSYTIAYTRLAPVQCVTWGHPETTGLPTMDYFVSCKHCETPESMTAYSEQLELLPRLGVCYERLTPIDHFEARKHFNFGANEHIYCCPQTLFKFHPEFDEVLGGILRSDPQAVLLLLDSQHGKWRELLEQRWKRTLGDVLNRVRFIKHQPRPDYLRLLAASDVMLDPLHFGGGNSTYEMLAMGTPVVTLPSPFLRARLTLAMYRQMEFNDLVVETPQQYVDLAVRLGTDADYCRATRKTLLERSSVLYQDRAIIRDYEAFFKRIVKR